MKKQLLAIVALLAVSSIGHAMQPQKSFSYNTYKFNIPANMLSGMKPGEKFVVTQVDPNQMSALYINDAQGNPFAKNTYSVYPGGRTPGLGTLTYTVLSEAERQNLSKTPRLPVAAIAKAAAQQAPEKGTIISGEFTKTTPGTQAIPTTVLSAPKPATVKAPFEYISGPQAQMAQTQKATLPQVAVIEQLQELPPLRGVRTGEVTLKPTTAQRTYLPESPGQATEITVPAPQQAEFISAETAQLDALEAAARRAKEAVGKLRTATVMAEEPLVKAAAKSDLYTVRQLLSQAPKQKADVIKAARNTAEEARIEALWKEDSPEESRLADIVTLLDKAMKE